jgi:hypothetical protein
MNLFGEKGQGVETCVLIDYKWARLAKHHGIIYDNRIQWMRIGL